MSVINHSCFIIVRKLPYTVIGQCLFILMRTLSELLMGMNQHHSSLCMNWLRNINQRGFGTFIRPICTHDVMWSFKLNKKNITHVKLLVEMNFPSWISCILWNTTTDIGYVKKKKPIQCKIRLNCNTITL